MTIEAHDLVRKWLLQSNAPLITTTTMKMTEQFIICDWKGLSKSFSPTCTYVLFYYAFTVYQVSALLPDEVDETSEGEADEIKFHVRKFDSQSAGSRLCGYYAVADAVSCCLRKDPTGSVYDENQLIDSFHQFKLRHNEEREPFPCIYLHNDIRTVMHVKRNRWFTVYVRNLRMVSAWFSAPHAGKGFTRYAFLCQAQHWQMHTRDGLDLAVALS